MKAVAQAGFLDPMIDPEKNLERLRAQISGKSMESSNFEDPVNGRPSCESLGITQSIDDMLAIEQVIRTNRFFFRKKGLLKVHYIIKWAVPIG